MSLIVRRLLALRIVSTVPVILCALILASASIAQTPTRATPNSGRPIP